MRNRLFLNFIGRFRFDLEAHDVDSQRTQSVIVLNG